MAKYRKKPVEIEAFHYEVTHNGDKGETYVDVYKKWENFTVKGGE